MPDPRNPWVSAQAAYFDRLITEQRAAYEGDTYWDWTRDQFVRYTLRYLPGDAAVLDVGCGDGYYAAKLAESDAVRSVVAIDVASAVIAYARAHHPSPKITFECVEFEEWDPPRRFDVVYGCEVIEHFDDAAAALERIARLLRPGGVLCVSTPNRVRLENILRRACGGSAVLVDATHRREFSLRELACLGTRHGFRTIATRGAGAWGEWAFIPFRAVRWVPGVPTFLRSDFARGRTRLSHRLGRLLGPLGAGLQVVMRKV